MASNLPESMFVFSFQSCESISALPTAAPIRQPVMFQDLDSENISTPASRAPGAARKLPPRGRRT